MQLKWAISLVVSVLMLSNCEVPTLAPLERKSIDVRIEPDQLICRIKRIAESEKLKLYYEATHQPPQILLTFRLVGDGYEVTLFNLLDSSKFELRAYETHPGKGAAVQARKIYQLVGEELVEDSGTECTSSNSGKFRQLR